MTESYIKNLAAATIMQAVKDFFADQEKQAETLKDLRSAWMDMFTGGMSIIVAEQLELHPEDIVARLRQHSENMPKK